MKCFAYELSCIGIVGRAMRSAPRENPKQTKFERKNLRTRADGPNPNTSKTYRACPDI
jgi:hypothetical protein